MQNHLLQNPLLVLQTAQDCFDFVQRELGEHVLLPWYCDQSKALEFLTYMRSSSGRDSSAIDPLSMAEAVARFYTTYNDAYHGGPELNSYRKALLELTRTFYPKQYEALSFLRCLTQKVPLDNWGKLRDVGRVVRSITNHLEAGNDWLQDDRFLQTEIPWK